MATQKELDKTYMDMAIAMSKLSKGVRAKVGAVAVTKNGVVITGVNGLPKELGNSLEQIVDNTSYYWNRANTQSIVSKSTVIHAENNILVKCAREGVSMLDSTIYTTLSCCEHCASMLASVGVKRVVYLDEYRCTKGIDVLKQCNIEVEKFHVTEWKQKGLGEFLHEIFEPTPEESIRDEIQRRQQIVENFNG